MVSSGTPSEAAKSPGPNTSASSGASTAAIRSTSTSPRAVSICASIAIPAGSRAATAATSSGDSTFGTATTSGRRFATAARSSRHHCVRTPLMRIASVPIGSSIPMKRPIGGASGPMSPCIIMSSIRSSASMSARFPNRLAQACTIFSAISKRPRSSHCRLRHHFRQRHRLRHLGQV